MSESRFTVRQGTLEDAEIIVEFNQAMAMETEDKTLDNAILTNGVTRLISEPERGFYLVASENDTIAGSLMITKEWSDWRNQEFWWIQSVYVAPEFRRQGVYRLLYQSVKELADQQNNVCGFRLYVEKENRVAQTTYENLGMEESYYLMYEQANH
ncbi:GNAT family N-acetyltransferase [Sessilibacter corallicola]|uniref:GNAT family N-acetyltransferase n=1 Tax=Sessilibacter corallicola TaxID=2904075 RepID=UPI001E45EB87|nr:GNAT family N-acetyltransferase [Sessilibacter corallicola]MCE2030432.1 GNAT family N-acetyltransferase [Sessilibacter corallicola]